MLLLPVVAPWLKLADAIDVAYARPNATVLLIHDGILSEPGNRLVDAVLTAVLTVHRYKRTMPGSSLTV